jgi:hypothetical protein
VNHLFETAADRPEVCTDGLELAQIFVGAIAGRFEQHADAAWREILYRLQRQSRACGVELPAEVPVLRRSQIFNSEDLRMNWTR